MRKRVITIDLKKGNRPPGKFLQAFTVLQKLASDDQVEVALVITAPCSRLTEIVELCRKMNFWVSITYFVDYIGTSDEAKWEPHAGDKGKPPFV